jgi:GWxTD domain-containing protein
MDYNRVECLKPAIPAGQYSQNHPGAKHSAKRAGKAETNVPKTSARRLAFRHTGHLKLSYLHSARKEISVTSYFRSFRSFAIFIMIVFAGTLLVAQTPAAQTPAAGTDNQQFSPPKQQEQDPLKRPRTTKQDEGAKKEKLGGVYKKWLDETVRWIITDEETSVFKKLATNAERDQFIEDFWRRRDPTPDTEENEYKEEYFRRVAYANERFAAGIPGWKTDRGRIYIVFGKPDSIDAHPAGGPYQRTAEEGGGETQTYPFETWRYRYIEGIGQEVEMEFVDRCSCGEYRYTIDRSEKDALLNVPNAGLTDQESLGLANKADRFRNFEHLGSGFFNQNNDTKQFDRLETFAKVNRAPEVKFKELTEEVVAHKIRYNLLHFDVRVDFVKVTADTALVPITIQMPLRDMTFINKDGVQRGSINILARLSKVTGQIVQTFEDTVHVDLPAELLDKELNTSRLYWKALPMRPGLYKLYVALKDVNGDKIGVFSRSYRVPDYSDDKLTTSTLILADKMEPVPSREVGTGSCVIGATKVCPRVAPSDGQPSSFGRNQNLNFWMQVYNLTVDEKTKKPSATVEYQVVNTASNQPVVDFTESTQQMGNVSDQLTLEKSLPLSKLDPGSYQVTIKIHDLISNQVTTSTAEKFRVQ